jgi:6-phosphogluconolactonase (cycloisomerase 2 family)
MSPKTAYLTSFSKTFATASLSMLAALLTACGGGGGGGSSAPPPPPPASYTIGGSISGLSGSGLMLQDNGGDTLAVSAGATTFTFATAVQSGKAYAVTVSAQPTSPAQTCTVTGGSGTVAAANVTNVSITCVTGAVTVGGTISGLTASGLVLQDNAGDNLTVASGATTFTFATPVVTGSPYAVTVSTQPTGETCTVSGGSGTAGTSAVTTVSIVCSSVTVTVGGTITGLVATGLVLQDNGGDNLTVSPGASFTFATPVSEGAPYNVTVLTQPTGAPLETCTVSNGSGTAGATNITSVVVTCVPATFSVGGTITGLSGSGLVLQDNGGDNLTVATAGTSFTFATALPVGATYAVTVATQPTGPAATCTVTNASGTIVASNVTSVTINCVGVGRYVYVVNSIDNGNPGDVAAFSINQTSGALTMIGTPATADDTPTGIAIDPVGQFAYVSNKHSADVSFFKIGSDGSLALQTNVPTNAVPEASIAISPSNQYVFIGGYDASGGAAWGASVTPATGALSFLSGGAFVTPDPLTSIAVDPTNTFVFATTSASNQVYAFSIGTGGALSTAGNTPIGNNGRSGAVAVWPLGTASGGYIYIADNGLLKVSGYAYDANGNLSTIPGTPLNTNGSGPQGMAIDPAGKYLYVTNSTDNTVSSFSINATNGALTLINWTVPTGNGPSDIKIDPSNQFAYVVNSGDGTISMYTVGTGANAGVLTQVGHPIATGSGSEPVALAIE